MSCPTKYTVPRENSILREWVLILTSCWTKWFASTSQRSIQHVVNDDGWVPTTANALCVSHSMGPWPISYYTYDLTGKGKNVFWLLLMHNCHCLFFRFATVLHSSFWILEVSSNLCNLRSQLAVNVSLVKHNQSSFGSMNHPLSSPTSYARCSVRPRGRGEQQRACIGVPVSLPMELASTTPKNVRSHLVRLTAMRSHHDLSFSHSIGSVIMQTTPPQSSACLWHCSRTNPLPWNELINQNNKRNKKRNAIPWVL